MIGVFLKAPVNKAVEEFFQLFKTPWEIFQSGADYEVVITDRPDAFQIQSRLVIRLDRKPLGPCESQNDDLRMPAGTLLSMGAVAFPVYTGVKPIEGGSALVKSAETNQTVGIRFRDGEGIVVHLGFDIFEEARYLLEHGQPLSFALYPTLDIHIGNLRSWIVDAGIPLVEIPPVSVGYKFFGALTHDVDFAGIRNHVFDHTAAGFIYRALVVSAKRWLRGDYPLRSLVRNWLAVGSLPLIYTGVLRDFWYTFKQYCEIENGAGSTFFVVPFKGCPGHAANGSAPPKRAVKYEVDDLQKEVSYIQSQGCEIGVHGIDSWMSPEAGRREIEKIARLTGQFEPGLRMHWLYSSPDSPGVIEDAGYAYDSTSGYNETIGCRAGTFQVFKHLGVRNLLQIPMHIMDTALFYPDRMNLTLSEGSEYIRRFIREAAAFGGALTFNWHHRSIAPERLWGAVYREALSELRAHGAKLAGAGKIVNWFRNRRSVEFERVIREGAFITVKLKNNSFCRSDGLALRVHASSGRRDYPLSGLDEITVDLNRQ